MAALLPAGGPACGGIGGIGGMRGAGPCFEAAASIAFQSRGLTPRRRGDSARRVQGPDKARLKRGPLGPVEGVLTAKSRKSPSRESEGRPGHMSLVLPAALVSEPTGAVARLRRL
jgi:hypothetical protein